MTFHPVYFQFKEISFAYEVLTNPEKKELYDRYGEQGLREGGGGGPGMDDIFSHIFGGGLFGFMGGQGRSRNGGRRRGEDMVHPLKWVIVWWWFSSSFTTCRKGK